MSKLENKATASYYNDGMSFSIDSNIVEYDRVDNVMRVDKNVYPTRGKSGDKVTFSIEAAATAPITGATLTDKLSGFTFVPGSVKVDHVPVTYMTPERIVLVATTSIAPITWNVSFDCTVD